MDAGLQREKRRRRILDNAESRLQRLRGIKKSESEHKTSAHGAPTREPPAPASSTPEQQPLISFLDIFHSPLLITIRLVTAVIASILALNTSLHASALLFSLIFTSLVMALAATAALLFPSSSAHHNLGWLHTLPSLLSSVSSTAGQVVSYGLAVASIVFSVARDLLLVVFFTVVCSLCHDLLT